MNEGSAFSTWFNQQWPTQERPTQEVRKDLWGARQALLKLEAEMRRAELYAERKSAALKGWAARDQE
jgi:hypothetical protein